MNQQLIYFPCFAMFTLHTIILFIMFKRRVSAIKEKKVNLKHFKTYSTQDNVPELCLQASRNYTNLCEAPVLFYTICIFAFMFGKIDLTFISLAWTYVILRCIHSFIHVNSNNVVNRMRAFGLSWLICYILAIKLLLNVISF